MTAQEVIEILKTAKELGFTSIKIGDIDASTNTVRRKNPVDVPDVKAEDLIKAESVFDELTDEEILFYSTPYYDELQAKKEAHKEALKKEESLK